MAKTKKRVRDHSKYKHITIGRMYDMKERFIAEQSEKHPNRDEVILIGSLWIQDFIQFVKKNKNV